MAAIAIWILMVESFYPPKYTLAWISTDKNSPKIWDFAIRYR